MHRKPLRSAVRKLPLVVVSAVVVGSLIAIPVASASKICTSKKVAVTRTELVKVKGKTVKKTVDVLVKETVRVKVKGKWKTETKWVVKYKIVKTCRTAPILSAASETNPATATTTTVASSTPTTLPVTTTTRAPATTIPPTTTTQPSVIQTSTSVTETVTSGANTALCYRGVDCDTITATVTANGRTITPSASALIFYFGAQGTPSNYLLTLTPESAGQTQCAVNEYIDPLSPGGNSGGTITSPNCFINGPTEWSSPQEALFNGKVTVVFSGGDGYGPSLGQAGQ